MKISTLVKILMGLIAAIVGFNLLKPITETVTSVQTATDGPTPTYSEAISFIFVVIIILGIIKGFMGSGEVQTERRAKLIRNTKEFIIKIENLSHINRNYLNNIGVALGITTINAPDEDNLSLRLDQFNNLYINNKSYDWYLLDKKTDDYPNLMFKVTGLHKKDSTQNASFIIGKNNDKVYLQQIPNKYIDTKIKDLDKELTKV